MVKSDLKIINSLSSVPDIPCIFYNYDIASLFAIPVAFRPIYNLFKFVHRYSYVNSKNAPKFIDIMAIYKHLILITFRNTLIRITTYFLRVRFLHCDTFFKFLHWLSKPI